MSDQLIRRQALDPTQSFIVQAPAGSGKTTLLIARYLTLLAETAVQPEEIIAMTFTRKAAAEMRHRILAALKEPNRYEHITDLAQKVIAKDKQLQWHLLENPKRLKIQTIDGFCSWLVNALPLQDEFQLGNNTSEFVDIYYEKACDQLLTLSDKDTKLQSALNILLNHFNNDYVNLKKLLCQMLKKRDQWLPHIIPQNPATLRQEIEKNFSHVIEDHLQELCLTCANIETADLKELIYFAQTQLKNSNRFADFVSYLDQATDFDLTTPAVEYLNLWKAIAYFLLTEKNTLRKPKGITVSIGFPNEAELKPMKQRMLNFLEKLASNNTFETLLAQTKILPTAELSDSQWSVLQALYDLLPWLVAQLKVYFNEAQVCDFVEVSLNALRALEENSTPTTLALYLEYKIKHILVDEFQDTSITQYQLLEKLTASWQQHDGHTLFLVGDPMQSIYRFRDAEVGLFLKAQQDGINEIKLKKLVLSSNHRSDQALVNWSNELFTQLMPANENISLGAIPFNPAQAEKKSKTAGVCYHRVVSSGKAIAQIIQSTLADNPQAHIAILLRNRNHFNELRDDLKQAGIDYNAVEMESLADLIIIQDLMTITRALLNLADRIAWLALLRAPWCGLKLDDLLAISSHQNTTLIWQAILIHETINNLSDDGHQRLNTIRNILIQSFNQKQRTKLSLLVEHTWLQFKGPAFIKNPTELAYAKDYFNLLDQLTLNYHAIDAALILEHVQHLHATENKSTAVEILTIHKAKGLEFDTVILPLLEEKKPADNSLLYWWLRPRLHHDDDLLLAPVKSYEQETDQHYQYLHSVESDKFTLETVRLLYVAATRAKNSLHLVMGYDNQSTNKKTLSGLILSALNDKFNLPADTNRIDENIAISNDEKSLLRIKKIPDIQSITHLSTHSHIDISDLIKDNNDERILGTVIHQLLYDLSQMSAVDWQNVKIDHYCYYLKQHYYSLSKISDAKIILEQTLSQIKSSKRAQWILAEHKNAASELALSFNDGKEIQHIVVDRSFYDQGYQWIIDYKTAIPLNDNLDQFYSQQIEYYRPQLEIYARALQLKYNHSIRCALYFPRFDGWIEWVFEEKLDPHVLGI